MKTWIAAIIAFAVGALADPGTVSIPMNNVGDLVVPVSSTTSWATVIAAGGMDDQDAATITNPTTEITDATRNIIQRGYTADGAYHGSEGVLLIVRLAYDDGLTSIGEPVVKVFGRSSSSEAWTLLETVGGTLTATISTAATDVGDGTYLYTTPDLSADAWDVQGCSEIIIGVETVLSGTGDVATAFLQAKML